MAAAARRRGADVVLVTTSRQARPAGAEVVEVETAAQMEDAMLSRAVGADVVVMAAAVADFRPKVAVDTKLHKSDGVPDLVLEATNDILAELGPAPAAGPGAGRVRRRDPRRAPTGPGPSCWPRASTSWWPTTSPPPSVGFDHDTNAVTIFGADGTVTPVPLAAKGAVADAVLDRVVPLLGGPPA